MFPSWLIRNGGPHLATRMAWISSWRFRLRLPAFRGRCFPGQLISSIFEGGGRLARIGVFHPLGMDAAENTVWRPSDAPLADAVAFHVVEVVVAGVVADDEYPETWAALGLAPQAVLGPRVGFPEFLAVVQAVELDADQLAGRAPLRMPILVSPFRPARYPAGHVLETVLFCHSFPGIVCLSAVQP